jgi:predicted ester cyclase
MRKEDIVKSMFADLQSNPQNTRRYYTDDFVFSGPTPEPVDAQQWIQIHSALNRAFPDFNLNVQDLREDKGKVTCTVHLTGTHKHELRIPDLPVVPSTGKKISMPKETVTISFTGEKISEVRVQKVPGGGLAGMFKQLGAEFPSTVMV